MIYIEDFDAVAEMVVEEWDSDDWSQSGLKSVGDMHDFMLYVVEEEGEKIGCAAMRVYEKEEYRKEKSAQLAVYVRREFRGHGFGRMMVKELHTLARSYGVEYVFSPVKVGNATMHNLLDSMDLESYPWSDDMTIRGTTL